MRRTIGLLAMLLCVGCSNNIHSSWGCATPVVDGQSCLTISQADVKANTQEKPVPESENTQVRVLAPTSGPSFMHKDDEVLLHRTQERVGKVWFAPFVDKYNNRHDQSVVYFVDSQSKWR